MMTSAASRDRKSGHSTMRKRSEDAAEARFTRTPASSELEARTTRSHRDRVSDPGFIKPGSSISSDRLTEDRDATDR